MQRFLTFVRKRYLPGMTILGGILTLSLTVRQVEGHTPASAAAPQTVKPVVPLPHPAATNLVSVGKPEVGQASWYGEEFQGHTTANGESFDMNTLTCAHRTIPLGSVVRVTNLRNHKSVMVRVNDRGPMLEDRVLDLSRAAAVRIGLHGIGRVRIERMLPEDSAIAKAMTKLDLVAKNNLQAQFPFMDKR